MLIGEKYIALNDFKFFNIKKEDVVEVVDVSENYVTFVVDSSEDNGYKYECKGVTNTSLFESNFVKLVTKETNECEHCNELETPYISLDYVDYLLEKSEIDIKTVFNKCTTVSCKLPNGYVIVESAYSDDEKDYREEDGFEICIERIRQKIWEFETYKFHSELYEENLEFGDCEYCNYDCPNNENI